MNYEEENKKIEFDVHIFHEGNHFEAYSLLGAHINDCGVCFRVWAPNAKELFVMGDFNNWNQNSHRMKKNNDFWILQIDGIKKGDKYKYVVETWSDKKLVKSDPYALYSELRPNTASIVWDLENYSWNDQRWKENKKSYQPYKNPMNIYEVHLGSWKKPQGRENFQTYRELVEELPKYVSEMGYTHVELMPISEYPLDDSWGYQSTGYFSVTSRHGIPEDFKYLIDEFHRYGIGVILDWVPGHFCKDAHGLYRFDGTTTYEYKNSTLGENEQWGTCNFDLSKLEIHSFLISNAMFWMKEYHIDGLRVDAVSNMLYLDFCKEPSPELKNKDGGNQNLWAIDFMQRLNTTIFKKFPNTLMIAEESTSRPNITKGKKENGLGFNYKWNMGWMNDILKYMELDPINRKFNHNLMTFSIVYAFSENYVLPFSHDEVVHGKKSLIEKFPGYSVDKFASLRLLLGYMMAHPGKKLLFMGGEIGQFLEWRFYESIEWQLLELQKHRETQEFVKDLNFFYRKEKSFWEIDHSYEGFHWLEANNNDCGIVSFMRKSEDRDDFVIAVYNFTPVHYSKHKMGVPRFVDYEEVLNSDTYKYGGEGRVNLEMLKPRWGGVDKELCHIEVNIAPLSVIYLKPKF
ncbi:1,4-alpha-glucan branching protein GlgB [Psychrilyobacter sp.]|uniref:1,4-alpha-glucan branching protein GlgB n=1 Tax=Psychrilyobacter sp. TaxID=2586924 RepID=UPI00301AC6B9